MPAMMAALVGTVGHGSAALWYLTRATGLVSLILLSATVVLGTVASVGWTTDRWPRFLSQSVHRNLSLFCLALIAIHVVSTVGDGYVPIGLADAVIPFRSPYRPVWVGLGALAFDLLLAVALTSALRRRIGAGVWRGVHWLAYACWPIAVVHGLGSGSDARLPGATLVFVACTGSVAAAVAWRLVAGRARTVGWRLGGALAAAAVLLVITAFAVAGPLRPGWSHRAGTSSALLAQLAGASATSYTGSTPAPTTPSTAPPVTSAIPATPFSTSVSGTVATSTPDARGESEVTLTMRLADTTAPLEVRIVGPAVNGGISMHHSAVSFGTLTGQVTALDGSNVGAVVNGPSGSISLTMSLALDPNAGTLTGEISGTSGQ
jgi:methionine sulfoxide reductase heme-binding subunit